MRLWNRVAVMRHIWDLVGMKESLWATWIIENKLKKLSFWGITKPLVASWNWQNLIKLRQYIKSCFKYDLGKGDCSFWFDPWCNGKAIVDLYPSVSFNNADVSKFAKVKDLWCRGSWRFPGPMDEHVDNMWSFIKDNFTIDESSEDKVSWSVSPSGIFSINSAWNHFREEKPRVSWWKVVWGPGNIPKQSFIAWLALKNRLRTKDKLMKWGCIDNDICVFCNRGPESINHLFFRCNITSGIFKSVMLACNINREIVNWRREWSWYSRRIRGKSLLAKVRRLAFVCTIYQIWRGRNKLVFDRIPVDAGAIKGLIKRDILMKMFAKRSRSIVFQNLYHNWYNM
ncbi:uncharacterized protein LOC126670147 [Mercurialis annua]|uniref:uncharacterized protein LOC126670147 n=1 Tax=Mercurialis annua TaxID=3986 RepID=UPI0021609DB6|nr:uncharacterized protein LOC126670147 [Mercurialis annua]